MNKTSTTNQGQSGQLPYPCILAVKKLWFCPVCNVVMWPWCWQYNGSFTSFPHLPWAIGFLSWDKKGPLFSFLLASFFILWWSCNIQLGYLIYKLFGKIQFLGKDFDSYFCYGLRQTSTQTSIPLTKFSCLA